MRSATVIIALACVAGACASIVHDIHAHPAYKYTYGVADKITGDQKSATEIRDGGVTKGSYSLVQPDGVLRTVNYIVTPHGGFQAQVINKGVAGHPAIYGKQVGIIGGHGIGGGLVGGAGIGGIGGLGVGRIGLGGIGSGASVISGIGSPVAGGIGGGLGLGAGIIG